MTTAGLAGRGRDLLLLGVYLLAALALTWPMAVAGGDAVAVRGDYQNNIWNAWWLGRALGSGQSPWLTDVLHHPLGADLSRHTLSPLNALLGSVLAPFMEMGPHAAFRWLVILHATLAGWCTFLLARAITGCTAGALLGGLTLVMSPYQAYYVGQINLASVGFLSLAAYFVVRTYRFGRAVDIGGLTLAAGLLAASASYYLVFAALLGGMLLLGGAFWEREVPFSVGARRVLLAALPAALLVGVVSWPLLSASLSGSTDAVVAAADKTAERSGDLLGFPWIGPPETLLVSWPTMLGWSTLVLLALGFRSLMKHPFWLAVALVVFVLGLGPELTVGGEATGLSLPYGLLTQLPVLDLLRKPDRFVLLLQIVLAVLAAFAWNGLSQRFTAGRSRHLAFLVCAVLIVAERAAVPWRTFPVEDAPVLAALAADPNATAVVDLPPPGRGPRSSRSNAQQVIHGTPMVGGYTTNLALTAAHLQALDDWARAWEELVAGSAEAFTREARSAGVNRVLLHSTEVQVRKAGPLHGTEVWAPFAWRAQDLVALRQKGHLVERALPAGRYAAVRKILVETFGAPLAEDAQQALFALDASGR